MMDQDWGPADAPSAFTASTAGLHPCAYCGLLHNTLCPRVKSIDYHPNGTTRHVEFWPPALPASVALDVAQVRDLADMLMGEMERQVSQTSRNTPSEPRDLF